MTTIFEQKVRDTEDAKPRISQMSAVKFEGTKSIEGFVDHQYRPARRSLTVNDNYECRVKHI